MAKLSRKKLRRLEFTGQEVARRIGDSGFISSNLSAIRRMCPAVFLDR